MYLLSRESSSHEKSKDMSQVLERMRKENAEFQAKMAAPVIQEPRLRDLPMIDYFRQTEASFQPPILVPRIEPDHFELNISVIEIVKRFCRFSGLETEDPYMHLKHCTLLGSTFQTKEVSEETVKMVLFPFSLADEAKKWFYNLPGNSITSWEQLTSEFLRKYHLNR